MLPLATGNGIPAALGRLLWVEHHQPAASRSGRGPTCVPHRQRWHGKRSAPAGEADTTKIKHGPSLITRCLIDVTGHDPKFRPHCFSPRQFRMTGLSTDPSDINDSGIVFDVFIFLVPKMNVSNLRKWRPQKIGYPVLIEEKRSMELGESDPGTSRRPTKGNL
jgi:hypothetical protein